MFENITRKDTNSTSNFELLGHTTNKKSNKTKCIHFNFKIMMTLVWFIAWTIGFCIVIDVFIVYCSLLMFKTRGQGPARLVQKV